MKPNFLKNLVNGNNELKGYSFLPSNSKGVALGMVYILKIGLNLA